MGAAEAALPTEPTPAPAAEETSPTKTEESGKESDVEPIVEAPKESETKDAEPQPAVVKEDEAKAGEGEEAKAGEEGEVKAAETATSAANLDNAANPLENVDKQETNATNDDKSAEESAS